MNNIYFSIACDTDPDINPCFRSLDSKDSRDHIWKGITDGIRIFRSQLNGNVFLSRHLKLPITWLLRSDRQIYEIYENPSFCFQQFEDVWETEYTYGSEIGWHPHLHCWSDNTGRWIPRLGLDDDIPILMECLNSLRHHVEIKAVRTGWDYHSNILMHFFNDQKLLVDASALPGCTQGGVWFYDWRGTPRIPYFISKNDYRQIGNSGKDRLKIIEMPALVRSLSLPWQITRYIIRKIRGNKQHAIAYLTDMESARWQGGVITGKPKPFLEAVKQTIAAYSDNEDIFLNTYFHTGELLSSTAMINIILNLEEFSSLAKKMKLAIVPVTLSEAASIWKQQNRQV